MQSPLMGIIQKYKGFLYLHWREFEKLKFNKSKEDETLRSFVRKSRLLEGIELHSFLYYS